LGGRLVRGLIVGLRMNHKAQDAKRDGRGQEVESEIHEWLTFIEMFWQGDPFFKL
jgi:hypothetical protein